ncbi:hypothetical protein DFH09DRAFT_1491183 [Mycena vulgaris]|nr:hypothetical protein DFH09DRAFT_1491183 [Mycena vulgaris]
MSSRQSQRDNCTAPTRSRTDRSKLAMTRSDLEDAPSYTSSTTTPRQLVPYLYLFSPRDGDATPTPGPWTHTLRLLPPSKTRPAGSAQSQSHTHAGHRLDLYLPGAAFTRAGARELHVSETHLLLARDFLGLALPYQPGAASAGHCAPSPFLGDGSPLFTAGSYAPPHGLAPLLSVPPSMLPHSQSQFADPVRVLVVGPPRAALAIGLTYLAYAAGCAVAQVLDSVVEGGEIEMALGRVDMAMLERVAMTEM